MIYFTSDTHFGHNKEFVYSPRGFANIEDMNEALIKNWNDTVSEDDDIYVLGDFFLGTDITFIENTLNELNGRIHLIIGNHDTPAKIELYSKRKNIVEIADALRLKQGKRQFFLCHYPTITSFEEQDLKKAVINLFGHTHSKEKFYEGCGYMYNVAVDANDNRPVSIEEIIELLKERAV